MNDTISRRAAVELVDWYQHEFSECDYAFGELANELHKLPSAEPQRKKGKWIPGKELSREMRAGQVLHIEYENFRCSACGFTIDRLLYHVDGSPFYKFCPNCGADMRGEADG